MSDWPTSWNNGETMVWDGILNPMSLNHARAVYAATVERRHACFTGSVTMPSIGIPVPFGNLSREFCNSIRAAIFEMTPKFINMGYNYAANDWMDFPKMMTLHDLMPTEDHNISEIPYASASVYGYLGWIAKAKRCLDLLYATPPLFPFNALNQVTGFFFNTESEGGMAAAVATAHTWDVTRKTLKNPGKCYKYWKLSVTLYTASPPDNVLYSADFVQNYNISLQHVSPLPALPVIVARRWKYGDDEFDVFNSLGTTWTEGLNPLEAFGDHEIRIIDNDGTIIDPSPLPVIEVPEVVYKSNQLAVGFELLAFIDWRNIGAFKFY